MPANPACCLAFKTVTYSPSVPISIVAPKMAQSINAPKLAANHAGSCRANPASAIPTAIPNCINTTQYFFVLYSSSSGAQRHLNTYGRVRTDANMVMVPFGSPRFLKAKFVLSVTELSTNPIAMYVVGTQSAGGKGRSDWAVMERGLYTTRRTNRKPESLCV